MEASYAAFGDGVFRFSPAGDRWEVPTKHIAKTKNVKSTLIGADLYGGYTLGIEDGRAVPWSVDLGEAVERLKKCEQGWVLLWTGAEFKASPMLCGNRWCPRCLRARTGRLAHKWVPVLHAAATHGAHVYHLAFTQRTRPWAFPTPDPVRPALVLPEEQRRYKGQALKGPIQYAVSGESLTGSYVRFREHWRAVRKNGATRDLWREALPAYLYGIEWTLRPKGAAGRGCVHPRWHCHIHVIAVVPGGWPRGMWGRLRQSWCDEVGGSPDAQWMEQVKGRGDQDLADALLEVCKYPIKLAELTVAAKVEAFASLRGTRPHHVGGAFHAASRGWEGEERVQLSGQEPWRTWLAEAKTPPSWPRLQWYHPTKAEWQLYTGQVHAGEGHKWRLGDDQPHWVAPADRYWSAMKEGLLGAGYAERDGVLLDDSAELDTDPDEGAA